MSMARKFITFSNVSLNLPNVPVNGAVIDKQSMNHDIYIGTDVGVFVLDESTQTWVYYGSALPNTMVSDLEIQYDTRKLRIGTFGRGVWENDLFSDAYVSNINEASDRTTSLLEIAVNPVTDVLLINVHNHVNAHGDFVVYDAQGREMKRMQRTLHEGHYQLSMNTADLPAGSYVVAYEATGFRLEGARFVKR